MTAIKSVVLPDRGVVRVGGADAEGMLQDLITNDMALLADNSALHAGLLSPQGKVLFDFFVVRANGAFLLETPRVKAAELCRRLTMYKLRRDVGIEDVSADYSVVAIWGAEVPALSRASGACGFRDPRLLDMGARLLVTLASDWMPGELDAAPSTHDAYDAHRVQLGVPEGGKDYAFGDAFPHDALFDQLNGVSFTKGCYVGQEVVSRMEHRGSARRRIVPVEGSGALPPASSEVRAGSSMIGTLGTVAGERGLANVRLDRVSEAMEGGKALTAADVELRVVLPQWARYSISSSGGGATGDHNDG